MKKIFTLCMALFVFVAMSVYAQDAKKEAPKTAPVPTKTEVKKDTTKAKAEVKKACTEKKGEAKKDTTKKETPKKK